MEKGRVIFCKGVCIGMRFGIGFLHISLNQLSFLNFVWCNPSSKRSMPQDKIKDSLEKLFNQTNELCLQYEKDHGVIAWPWNKAEEEFQELEQQLNVLEERDDEYEDVYEEWENKRKEYRKAWRNIFKFHHAMVYPIDLLLRKSIVMIYNFKVCIFFVNPL